MAMPHKLLVHAPSAPLIVCIGIVNVSTNEPKRCSNIRCPDAHVYWSTVTPADRSQQHLVAPLDYFVTLCCTSEAIIWYMFCAAA